MKGAWYGGGAWMSARGLLRVEGNHPPIYRNDNANVVPQACADLSAPAIRGDVSKIR
jgi:hypothetical protein